MPRRKPEDRNLSKYKPINITQFAEYDRRGSKLQRMREKAGISRWYMAERLGVTVGHINSIEMGFIDADDDMFKAYRRVIKHLNANSTPADPNRELRWSAPRLTDKAEGW